MHLLKVVRARCARVHASPPRARGASSRRGAGDDTTANSRDAAVAAAQSSRGMNRVRLLFVPQALRRS